MRGRNLSHRSDYPPTLVVFRAPLHHIHLCRPDRCLVIAFGALASRATPAGHPRIRS
jgi:hypothetical protein